MSVAHRLHALGARLTPGDKVGDIVLARAKPGDPRIAHLCQFAAGTPNPIPPGVYHIICRTPVAPALWFDEGWIAKTQQHLDANWRGMTWEVSIDGRPVDLAAFGTFDDATGTGADAGRRRSWNVALERLAGQHTIRTIQRFREEVFDGWATYRAGTYDKVNAVTVTLR